MLPLLSAPAQAQAGGPQGGGLQSSGPKLSEPAPQVQAAGPQVIVRETPGAPLASLEIWFRAPSAGFEAKQTPGLARLAAQVVSASKPIVGESLDRVVGDLGGRLTISAFSDSVSVTAVVPSGGARRVLSAMTRAYFSPVLSEDGYRSAARAVSIDAAIQSFNPEVVGRDAVFAALFTSGPKLYPPGGDPEGIGAIELDAIRGFAKRAFRAPNAVVVATGRVTPDLATAVAAGRPADDAAAAATEPPVASVLAAQPEAQTRRLDENGGALGWAGPPIRNEREATALDFIADYLFRPGSGTVIAPLSEREPAANLTGQFITLRDPGVFLITFTSAHSDELRASIESALAGMQKPLEKAAFARALDAFEARIATDVQTATEVSDNLGWYTVEGNPKYAPIPGLAQTGYFAVAATLTPAFVAETARKYLARPAARVTFALDPKSPAPKTTKAGA
jgi:predicted Zn-dependent peptidase